MRVFGIFLMVFLFCATDSAAQWGRRRQPVRWPKTEGELMHKLLHCLQTKDTAAYVNLFPPFDTLWHMVMHNTSKSPEVVRELNQLKERPQLLIDFDPRYNYSIVNSYSRVLAKGDDSGLFWRSVVMARYQLVKQEPTRNLVGYENIAPERFRGYMFVTDPSNRITFCISVAEIQKINGSFFGGQVLNVLEANSVDDYNAREEAEHRYFEWLATHPDMPKPIDTAAVDSAAVVDSMVAANPLLLIREEAEEDEDDDPLRKEVVERRYYEGLLDNEIKVRLYVRCMKIIPGKPRQYDGLYKLGETKRYLRIEIIQKPDGKWILEDESGVGTMELMLSGNTYSGIWSNSDDNGYDVVLHQTGSPQGKIELLDKIIDKGLSGRVDEDKFSGEEAKGGDKPASDKKKDEEKDKKREKHKKEKKRKKDKKK